MKSWLAIITLFFYLQTHAQNSSIEPILQFKIPFKADKYVGADELGFFYFLKDNTLFKIKDNQSFEYKNLNLGKIAKVDLQNPLRILLFYENFNTIIALDNQMNEISKINFSEINRDIAASAIGTAAQNSCWVFNQLDQRLGLYNFNKNNFQPIGLVFEKPFANYCTSYNSFFWIDTDNQLCSSDIFGKKTARGPIPAFDKICLTDEETLLYQKGEKLWLYDLQKKTTTSLKNIEKSFESFEFKNQILAIFTAEGLSIYNINRP